MTSPDSISIVSSLSSAQIDDLVQLYIQEWWTKGRVRPDVERMLAGSDVILGLVDTGSKRLSGFGRAITDGVYKALILDIIVAPTRRGEGLGALIMDKLLEHPLLKHVRHKELYCLPDMSDFYTKWNFESDLGDLTFMRSKKSGCLYRKSHPDV